MRDRENEREREKEEGKRVRERESKGGRESLRKGNRERGKDLFHTFLFFLSKEGERERG